MRHSNLEGEREPKERHFGSQSRVRTGGAEFGFEGRNASREARFESGEREQTQGVEREPEERNASPGSGIRIREARFKLEKRDSGSEDGM